jgi:hypothetical protein
MEGRNHMKSAKSESVEARVAEIERLVREFNEKFEAGTSNPEKFMSMNEIERMWGELRSSTDNIYSDMVGELLSSVDEGGLIRKKKENTKKRGSN